MMRAIITRYAPAPTGFLHIGHVVNAIYVWGVTRLHGGRVLLRIEDHDRRRSHIEYESAMREDLAWLGFVADEPAVRQSERGDIYAAALDDLRARGLVYACACSRAEIAAALKGCATGIADADPTTSIAQPVSNATQETADATTADATTPVAQPFRAAGELRYPGTCRERGLVERPGLGVRVRLDPSVERFVDLRHGRCEQRPFAQCGDPIVRARDGNWTYQFAATVDDWRQGVTLVIRGDDLLESTGRQIQLARLLGRRDPPRFLHHALVMKSATQKLSKSDRDTGVRALRAQGWTPESVVGHAAALAGLIPEHRDIHAGDVSSIMSAFKEVHL